MFTHADDIIQKIEKRKNRGHGLQHFKDYMTTLHNPHDTLNIIHIAGTNGKGSSANYIRSILNEAGYKVATFTSPYMITHLDRIRIDDVNIKEDAFVELTNRYYDSWMAWDLSMFEIDMCLAVLYFVREGVDFAIFEVGIGGRLDTTNIVTPLISVITNIGLDHTELLGNTYEKIAAEKAGIIKPGIDLITSEWKRECLRIFREHTEKAHSICITTNEVQNLRNDPFIHFDYKKYKDIQLSTAARYQCYNASLALETCQYLQQHHSAEIQETHIRKGLQAAIWIGRFEIISQYPLIILDGAHNAHGIHALCENLQQMQGVQIIFSVLKDKNFEEMLDALEKVSDDISVCSFQNERALDIQVLRKRTHIHIVENYKLAIQQALAKRGTIVITGSLYFISEVRQYLLRM